MLDDESGESIELMEEVPHSKNWVRQNWRD